LFPTYVEGFTRTFVASGAIDCGIHSDSCQCVDCGNRGKSAENGQQSMLARQLLKSITTGDPGMRWFEQRVTRAFRRAPPYLIPPGFVEQQGTCCRSLRVI
jgi:hypothetical protein